MKPFVFGAIAIALLLSPGPRDTWAAGVDGTLLNQSALTEPPGTWSNPNKNDKEYVNHEDSVIKVDVALKNKKGQTRNARGTAWYIGKNRFITNAHVVIQNPMIVSTDLSYQIDGKTIKLNLILRDEENDIAVLQSEEPVNMTPLKIITDIPKIGTEVETMGYGLGGDLVHFWGRIGSKETPLEQEDDDDTVKKAGHGHSIIKIGSPAIAGMSGGPVLNDRGEVVGVTEIAWPASSEMPVGAMNFFIPSHIVLDVIKKSEEVLRNL
jgi:S1-C subfamily serine protease